jgi:hypothetical protein
MQGRGRPPGAGIVTPGKITLKGGACGAVTRDSLREPWTVIFTGMTGVYRDDGQDRSQSGVTHRSRRPR